MLWFECLDGLGPCVGGQNTWVVKATSLRRAAPDAPMGHTPVCVKLLLPMEGTSGVQMSLDEKELRWRSKYPSFDIAWPPSLKANAHSTGFGPRSFHNRETALEEELPWLWRKHTFATGERRPDGLTIVSIGRPEWEGVLDEREEVPCPKRHKKAP